MLGPFHRNAPRETLQQRSNAATNSQQEFFQRETAPEAVISQQISGQSAADYLREMFLKECDTHVHSTFDGHRAPATSLNASSVSVPGPISGIIASQGKRPMPSLSLKDSIRELPLPIGSSSVSATSSNAPAKAARPRVAMRSAPSEHINYLTLSHAPAQESPEFTDYECETNVKPPVREPRESLDSIIEHDLTGSLLFDMANAVSSSVAVRTINNHE